MAAQIRLTLETLPCISTDLSFGWPKGVERLVRCCSSRLEGWCGGSGGAVWEVDLCSSGTRRKTLSLAHVIINSRWRWRPLDVFHDARGCFIFPITQLPLDCTILARWFLSVVRVSVIHRLTCVYLAAKEGFVSTELPKCIRALHWPIWDLKLYFQTVRLLQLLWYRLFSLVSGTRYIYRATGVPNPILSYPHVKMEMFFKKYVWNQRENGRDGAEVDYGMWINRGWEHL